MVIKHRPVKRLLRESPTGEGKAQVATKKQFKNILWQASRGTLGKRSVAIIWMLFGSGLRINEVAKLEVKDLLYPTGGLKTTFTVKGTYTKTDKARAAFILAKQHKNALEAWVDEMVEEGVCYSEDGALQNATEELADFCGYKASLGVKCHFGRRNIRMLAETYVLRPFVVPCKPLLASCLKIQAYTVAVPILVAEH